VPGLTLALIYHDVVTIGERDATGFPGPVAGRYKLAPDHFAAHLDAIAATGVSVGLPGTGEGAMLTFDDGGVSALLVAAELERRGWRGQFFVVTSRIGTPGFLDADGVRELARRGHEIGSHSDTHPSYMARLAPSELAREWGASSDSLSGMLGRPPRSAAVPGGSVSRSVIEQAARAGYDSLYTSTPRLRPRRCNGIVVYGRLTMWASDTPALAAAFVRGARRPRARRWLTWQVKSAIKRVGPDPYERVRALRAARFS